MSLSLRINDGFTMQAILHRAATFFAHSEAVVDDVYRYTYAELLRQVRRTASLYHSLGVRKGDRVALMLYPSPIHVVSLFAAWELGAIPVALHMRESAMVLSAALDKLSPRVMVYDLELHKLADALRTAIPGMAVIGAHATLAKPALPENNKDVIIPDELPQYDEKNFKPRLISENDAAVIVLSSGTTGVPKGVVHTHRSLTEVARGGQYAFGAKPHDCIAHVITTSFMGWYNMSLPFLNVGAKNVYLRNFEPKTYLQTVQDEGVTVAFLIPTMWRMLLRQDPGRFDLNKVRLGGFAGEIMDPETLKQIQEKITPKLTNIYGSTESGSLGGGTINFSEDMYNEEKLTSVGKPQMNSVVCIIKPGGTVDDQVAPGEEGEIIISGPSVAYEIWDDPALTQKVFDGPWWRSGDQGRVDEDGFLYVQGRIDDMIISGGINILPAQIEEELLKHPNVSEAAVVGLPDEVWGQRVAAAVVLKENNVTSVELDEFLCGSKLSNYQRPRHYEIMDALPRTATGKLSRRLVRELLVNTR